MADSAAGETPPEETVETTATSTTQSKPDREPTPAELKAESESLKAALKKANDESASRRKRLKELEDAEAKRREDELSESEKRERRSKELEASNAKLAADLLNTRIETAVERTARSAGFEYPEDVFKLIDPDTIKVDEDGKIDQGSIKRAVEKLAEARPKLVAGAKKNGTPERGRGSPQVGGEWTEESEYTAQLRSGRYGF